MMVSRAYHGLDFCIAKSEGNRVCYILLPEGLRDDGTNALEECAARHQCSIVLVTGMDWNKDLTPWPAPGFFIKEKPFGGYARNFLKDLLNEYFPSIESFLNIKTPERFLVGVSLSGLFAVWSLWASDSFKAVASVSGSLWYDGLISWAQSTDIVNSGAKVFLSLGDKEKRAKDTRLAMVEDATATMSAVLAQKGCPVEFKLVPGTHFSPIVPRLAMALDSIL